MDEYQLKNISLSIDIGISITIRANITQSFDIYSTTEYNFSL